MQQLVYKVCPRGDWEAAIARGRYEGSADDRRDGFIHLSTAAQLPGTLAKFFAGRADLVLVAVPVAALGGGVRWEPSRGGQLFPHVYGVLPVDIASSVRPLALGAGGIHVLPEDVA